ncbi:MAG: hypothetical protein ACP5NZ_00135 [Nanobdellota archaeon]
MGNIQITPEINYKAELKDGTYYPALLEMVDFDEKGRPSLRKEGWAEIIYCIPNSRNKLSLVHRSLNVENFKHLAFSDLKEGMPKVFIEKGLAELLNDGNCSEIPPSKVKNASEVQDYLKYFNILDDQDELSPPPFY